MGRCVVRPAGKSAESGKTARNKDAGALVILP